MGPVGVQEMVVIFLVALVLFGPKKLPELGKTIGKAITEFRRAQSELKATFETHMRELEKESESIKEVTRSYSTEINQSASDFYNRFAGYDSSYYDSGAVPAGAISTTATPSTVGELAPQSAETSMSPGETQVNGTVARNGNSITAEHPALEHPAEGQISETSRSEPSVSQPAEPESINT